MLLIETEIKPSPIAGYGLFAKNDILKGTAVWVFNKATDIKITHSEFEDLNYVGRLYYMNFCYYNNGCYILCGDNAKYTNHSVKPNLVIKDNSMIADRDILAGEELTEDYFNYDELANYKLNN